MCHYLYETLEYLYQEWHDPYFPYNPLYSHKSCCFMKIITNPKIQDYFMQRNRVDRRAMLQEIKYAPIPAQVKRKKILVADIECGLLNGAGYLSAKEHFKSNQVDRRMMLEEIRHAPIPAQVARKKILIADIKCRLVE